MGNAALPTTNVVLVVNVLDPKSLFVTGNNSDHRVYSGLTAGILLKTMEPAPLYDYRITPISCDSTCISIAADQHQTHANVRNPVHKLANRLALI